MKGYAMNKQSKTPASAALVIAAEREYVIGAAKADTTLASWFTDALNRKRGDFARDAKGTGALQKAMQGELTEAAIALAMTPKKDGGLGLRKKAIDEVGTTWFKVLALVVAPTRISTYKSYFSGVARAHAHEAPWTARSHCTYKADGSGGLPDVPWKGGAQGPTTGGVAKAAKTTESGATVKVDAAKHEVHFMAGSKGTDPQAIATILTAIGSDPGRVALAVNYCKAQGWIK